MCYGCWEEADKPLIDTPATRNVAARVGQLYERFCAGGALHIVTDDWNCEDDSVQFCIDYITSGEFRGAHGDEATPEDEAFQLALAQDLLKLTEAERQSALAIWEGFAGAGRA